MISNIEESLSSIINVDGINGTMAIDKNKDILGALMPDLYDHDSLVDVADQIGMTYGTLKELKIRPEEITFEYEGMHLFMKDLRGKGILVVLHDSDVSNAFLNIATNIARKQIVSALNESNTSRKVSRSPKKTITSATDVKTAFQTSNVQFKATSNLAVQQEVEQTALQLNLSDEMLVFNNFMKNLYMVNSSEFPGYETDLIEFIQSSLKKSKINPIVITEFEEWFKKPDEIFIYTLMTEKEMHAIVHPLYIFLCELHGPIEGDMILNRALEQTESLPQAKTFSPRKFL